MGNLLGFGPRRREPISFRQPTAKLTPQYASNFFRRDLHAALCGQLGDTGPNMIEVVIAIGDLAEHQQMYQVVAVHCCMAKYDSKASFSATPDESASP
jgi:hypothetical protein